ncbi:MAG TPA: DUF1830 domain-containing protein [Leptolyngbyaceae cyanobacterium]
MLQIPTNTPTDHWTTENLCYYHNTTDRIQIVRITQSIPQRFEKVLFPKERVFFYSTLEASLDIYTSTTTSLALVDRVPCSQLQVIETEFYSGLQVG